MTDQKPQEGDKKTSPTDATPVPVHHGDTETKQHPVEPKVIAATSDTGTQEDQRNAPEEGKVKEKWNRGHRQTAWGIVINGILVAITGISILVAYRSLKITQDALAVTQKQFETANQPYLQISHIVDSLGPDKPPVISFRIDNLGNQPAKILFAKYELRFYGHSTIPIGLGPVVKVIKKGQGNLTGINKYCIKESPYDFTWSMGIISKNEYDSVIKGDWRIMFHGEIIYKSVVTETEMRYHFSASLSLDPKHSNTLYVNTNKPEAYVEKGVDDILDRDGDENQPFFVPN